MKNLLTIFLLLTTNFFAYGDTYTWNGAAGDMKFTTAGNWNITNTPGGPDYVIGPGSNSSQSNPITDVTGNASSLSITSAYIEVGLLLLSGGKFTVDNSVVNVGPGKAIYITPTATPSLARFAVEMTNNSKIMLEGNLWTQNSVNAIEVYSGSSLAVLSTGWLRVIAVGGVGFYLSSGTTLVVSPNGRAQSL